MTNCVYIFGNGLDLRIGLPTSYRDFLNFYEGEECPNREVEVVKHDFISEIKEKQGENPQWKDLEIALGLFTEKVSTVKMYISFYRDFCRQLINYLYRLENLRDGFSTNTKNKFIEDLRSPESYLHLKSQKVNFNSLVPNDNVNANIITFNYTHTIESLLDWKDVDKPLVLNSFKIETIKHIHGKILETDLLFGLNDMSQIANQEFCTDDRFMDLMIKPRRNDELDSHVDKECETIILNADIFYIFGSSLGSTDQYWWNLIGSRFNSTNNTVIVYFEYLKEELEEDMFDTQYISLERPIRKRIMERMGIDGNEKDFRNRIYVACNREIYPNPIKPNSLF